MLSITKPFNNYSQIKFQSKKTTEPEKKSNGTSKAVTGLLATTAFVAGLETGRFLPNTDRKTDNKTIIAEQNINDKPDSTLTWSEALKRENLGPREGNRTWTTTTTSEIKGKMYNINNQYIVQEVPFLVKQDFYKADTKELVQTSTYGEYHLVPQKTKDVDGQGKFISSQEFIGFNTYLGCPHEAKFKDMKDDGSIHTTNVSYSVDLSGGETEYPKSTQKPKPKAQPKKTDNNFQNMTTEQMDDIIDKMLDE